MGVYDNFDNVIRCATLPIGSYMLANNGEGTVDTMYREYQLRANQVVGMFGKQNVSQSLRRVWENNSEAWVDICHAIEPNDDRDNASPINSNMAFRSVYWEKGTTQDKFLRQSGFMEFPIMAPRWDVTGEDVYGTDSPGIMSIGDVKALQTGEVKKAKGIGKQVDPPLQAPSSMRGQRISLIEGDVSYVDAVNPNSKIESIYSVQLDLSAMQQEILGIEQRVNQAYFVDLFLMFNTIGNRDRVTAEEIAKRHEEKLLMLGPMYERLEDELLSPMINRIFNMSARAGILPEAPPELAGQELNVEYISILAQAQKAVASSTIERTAQFVGTMAGADPRALDKIDIDQTIDRYADAIGTPHGIIRDDQSVAQLRANREQQERLQQAAQAAEAAVPATEAVKNLSQSETTGTNALANILALAR